MVDSGMSQDELYEEQESELEALKCIYMDDIQVLEEKPYKLQIQLNSNNESDDKNHLKLRITLELKEDYPHSVPSIRIKNLSQDIIDNNMLIVFEKMINTKAEESVGTQMIYDVCEHLREQLANMNEKILDKLQEIADANSVDKALQKVTISQDAPMNFTPVTKETFAKWLDEYNEKRRKMKEEMKQELDIKPTGRELFTMKSKVIEEINIDEDEDGDDEEFKDETGDDEEEDGFEYDQALYVREEVDEDVDFD